MTIKTFLNSRSFAPSVAALFLGCAVFSLRAFVESEELSDLLMPVFWILCAVLSYRRFRLPV